MTNSNTEEQFETIDGVACFASVEQAVQGFSYCHRYYNIRRRNIPSQKMFSYDRNVVEILIQKGRKEKVLSGDDALPLLAAFGIPVVRGIIAQTREEIEQRAASLNYPLVLKLGGKDFLHKSEWGGVAIGIDNPQDLIHAFEAMTDRVRLRDPQACIENYQLQEQAKGKELLLGLKHDPNFGPAIVCGMGGIYTEVFKDISRELVPIGREEAQKMLQSLKIYPLLKGVRGEIGIDWEALLEAMERLSFLAIEIPDLTELDINPLMADAKGCRAVDARILW